MEYKTGWNPEAIMHTICAFANDINDLNGGYIIIGIDATDGVPNTPIKGLELNQLDKIQRELIGISNSISPAYHPVSWSETFEGKYVLIIWAPGGDVRPYSAPVESSKKGGRAYYVRRHSNTVRANVHEEEHLRTKAAKIPFDDRINHAATLQDIDLGLIREFLQQVKSPLFEQSDRLSLESLCQQLRIVRTSNEALVPLNIGLLMFCLEPEKFFPGAQIEIVFRDKNGGRSFREHIIKGPIHHQIKRTLQLLEGETNLVQVIKQPDKPEAQRFANYPFQAVEEAIVNAVYHRSYEVRNTIEINVLPDSIKILSYPGPLPPVNEQVLASNQEILARDNRNRRIGDFLKELKLTEGRATGIQLIRRLMAESGAPMPEFITDSDATFFLTILKKSN
ncbi:MAG: RNA-binding domain-containing protein, partial [Flexibacteraceae bacterium]